ncbi:MAG: Asp-tRNA(Asn)/Glu-tRNA(Gln) amidotransferase subunit GatC [Candidatus Pacebacteria bacterium]|nr:Asp-tRNA(Asn)/Glu-tRNA(Gln) amidotransferase subunit GatC [Candidatus Paceibacterota bacterium]
MSNIEFTKKDLENVAMLSRLSLTEEEKEKFLTEMKEILNYVGQVSEMAAGGIESSGGESYGNQFLNSFNKNEMREDIILNEGRGYTEKLLANAPDTKDDFVKVSKVIKK